MTSEATAGQIPDVYGQVHPLETKELLATKLQELEDELHQLPMEEKSEWMEALAKCPELVAEDFKLKFLRCEVFNSDVSERNAKRQLFMCLFVSLFILFSWFVIY